MLIAFLDPTFPSFSQFFTSMTTALSKTSRAESKAALAAVRFKRWASNRAFCKLRWAFFTSPLSADINHSNCSCEEKKSQNDQYYLWITAALGCVDDASWKMPHKHFVLIQKLEQKLWSKETPCGSLVSILGLILSFRSLNTSCLQIDTIKKQSTMT